MLLYPTINHVILAIPVSAQCVGLTEPTRHSVHAHRVWYERMWSILFSSLSKLFTPRCHVYRLFTSPLVKRGSARIRSCAVINYPFHLLSLHSSCLRVHTGLAVRLINNSTHTVLLIVLFLSIYKNYKLQSTTKRHHSFSYIVALKLVFDEATSGQSRQRQHKNSISYFEMSASNFLLPVWQQAMQFAEWWKTAHCKLATRP